MTRPSLLDPDIEQAITAVLQPADDEGGQADAAIAAAVSRVRSRLMQRIAAESVPFHHTVPADAGRWHFILPGIQRKVLHESEGVMSYLLRFAPGAVLPAHRHPIDEDCVVLEGSVRIGDMVLTPGAFHRVAKDVLDADTTSDEGAVIYLRGASPKAEHLV